MRSEDLLFLCVKGVDDGLSLFVCAKKERKKAPATNRPLRPPHALVFLAPPLEIRRVCHAAAWQKSGASATPPVVADRPRGEKRVMHIFLNIDPDALGSNSLNIKKLSSL